MPIVLSPQADPVSPAVEMLNSKERLGVQTYATSIGQSRGLDPSEATRQYQLTCTSTTRQAVYQQVWP
jgi:hypothetical protein